MVRLGNCTFLTNLCPSLCFAVLPDRGRWGQLGFDEMWSWLMMTGVAGEASQETAESWMLNVPNKFSLWSKVNWGVARQALILSPKLSIYFSAGYCSPRFHTPGVISLTPHLQTDACSFVFVLPLIKISVCSINSGNFWFSAISVLSDIALPKSMVVFYLWISPYGHGRGQLLLSQTFLWHTQPISRARKYVIHLDSSFCVVREIIWQLLLLTSSLYWLSNTAEVNSRCSGDTWQAMLPLLDGQVRTVDVLLHVF